MNLILKQNITEIGNDIISIDETGIVLKRIDCTFGLYVVPMCTQLI